MVIPSRRDPKRRDPSRYNSKDYNSGRCNTGYRTRSSHLIVLVNRRNFEILNIAILVVVPGRRIWSF